MEKKNIWKVILIAFILLVLMVVLVCLSRRNTIYTPPEIISEQINDKVNLEVVFNELEKIIPPEMPEGLGILPEETIDLGIYKELELKAIINTTVLGVDEVWMIKLEDYAQQEGIVRLFGNRVQELTKKFEGNEEQLNIIDQAVIKQEDGIVIVIISPDVEEIEQTIANTMK